MSWFGNYELDEIAGQIENYMADKKIKEKRVERFRQILEAVEYGLRESIKEDE